MVKRNIALLCLDTVRADKFEELIERLDVNASVFTSCYAASSWSVPSHASILTGKLPTEHGVHAYTPRYDELSRKETLLGDIKHTAVGVSANVYAGSAYGLDTLFDTFVDINPSRRFPRALNPQASVSQSEETSLARIIDVLGDAVRHNQPLRSLANVATMRMRDIADHGSYSVPFDDGARIIRRAATSHLEGEEPWFLFANFMDAHDPHRSLRVYDDCEVPPDWRFDGSDKLDYIEQPDAHDQDFANLETVYEAAISYLDREVATLVSQLRKMSDRDTTIVITADHGENLGGPADDGLVGHVGSLSQGLIHVPLLIINPPEGMSPKVTSPVSHLSLRELLGGIANGETLDITGDRIQSEVVGLPPGNQDLREHGHVKETLRRCIIERDSKYEWTAAGDQRVLNIDRNRPSWQVPSSDEWDNSVEAVFETAIEEADARARTRATTDEVDDATRDRLEELGYL